MEEIVITARQFRGGRLVERVLLRCVIVLAADAREQAYGMPGERLNPLGGNFSLPIPECERQPEAFRAIGRAQRFEGDGVKAGTADARRGRVEETFWDFRFQISDFRLGAGSRTKSNLKSEMKNLK